MFFHKSHVMHFVFCWCKDMDIFPQMHNTGNIVIHSDLFIHLSFATLSYCLSLVLVKMADNLGPMAWLFLPENMLPQWQQKIALRAENPSGRYLFFAIAIFCRYWTCSFSGSQAWLLMPKPLPFSPPFNESICRKGHCKDTSHISLVQGFQSLEKRFV